MDLHKLKLDQFHTYDGFNVPQGFQVPLQQDDNPEVYFVFLQSFEELNRYTNIIINQQKNKNNRIFYIYKKGKQSFHRDHIAAYARRSPFLQRKAPMLCSLSKTYSCFTFMVKGVLRNGQ